MKFAQTRPPANQAGNALIVVMAIIGLLIAALGTYLSLASQENNTVMRSNCWNNALPLAEAGVEEAMSHLGRNTNSYAVDGWQFDGTNYGKQRFLGTDYYNVTFSGVLNTGVTITSMGAVQWSDGSYIKRTVQTVARSRIHPPTMGLVAKMMTVQGNFYVDAYDSSTNTESNPAKFGWYDPALHTGKAFMGNPLTSFTLSGSSEVRGYVASGRGYAKPTVAGSALVGDLSYSGKWDQAGHATNGFFVAFPDVWAPYTSGSAPVSGTVRGTNYNYVLTGNDYYAAALSSSATMYVTGYTRLYVTGSVNVASITFADAQSRLDLYVAAPSIDFAPAVYGAAPPQFVIWGLPTCKSMKMTGGKQFVGVIYAPEADLNATGGSEFYGAISANSFKCGGGFILHHDLGASKTVPPETLTILSWAEL
ncbi:MAG TPA: collagen-binding domain-containing protein [Candidatus Dormibacteraeota bacterium]|nr:collagen-binding domain-containing protein [Candidatus Dormibacteraeota bacterium]